MNGHLKRATLFGLSGAMLGALAAQPVLADINVGVILSLTGPAASLGAPAQRTIDLLPRKIGDEPVQYTVIDDASDPSAAVRAARKLIDENKVDIIFGPSVTPTSLAVVEVAGEAKIPMISFAGSAAIASPVEGNKQWSYVLVAPEQTMAHYVYARMKEDGDKTIAFIGFADAFGDNIIKKFSAEAEAAGIQVVADERFNAKDTSVTAQVLSAMSKNPDAILIGASGTPGVTPVIELRNAGYQGQIYLNQGMANADVLRVGGKALDGVMLSTSPVMVAEQLPEDNPLKTVATDYVTTYEAKYGEGSRSLFGATAWDAFLITESAAARALTKAKPGTPEFRAALSDEMQSTNELVGAEAVFTMSPSNHNGTDLRAQTLVKVEDGKWIYVPLK